MIYTVIIYKDGENYVIESKKDLALSVWDLKTEKAEHVYTSTNKNDINKFINYIKDTDSAIAGG